MRISSVLGAVMPSAGCYRPAFSVPQLVATLQQEQRQRCQAKAENSYDDETRLRRNVGQAEKAVAKAVDHIEERIEMRQRLPERRQAVDRVEHARSEERRHDQEILERRKLVELVGGNAGDQTQRAQDRTSQQREGERPQRMGHRQGSEIG